MNNTKNLNDKSIQSIRLNDEYYPTFPPSYKLTITYTDYTASEKTVSAVDVYQKYKEFLSARSLNRVKDALRAIPWNLGFEVEPNEPVSSVESPYSFWGSAFYDDDFSEDTETHSYTQRK